MTHHTRTASAVTVALLTATSLITVSSSVEAATKPKSKATKAVAAKPATKTIAEVAVGNKDFSTLVTALSAAGLVDTLKGSGPFTVFAPTNAAFAKLPKSTLDALLADKAKLTEVLTYHVVSGKVPASVVVTLNGKSAKTLNGAEVAIGVAGGKVTLNGNVNVIATDVAASNGVIHVIDTVLLPPAPATAPTTAPTTTSVQPAPSPTTTIAPKPGVVANNIIDIASSNKDFSTLVAAVKAAGLVDTLQGPGPFTVLAPTNAAFAVLGKETLDTLLKPENKQLLVGILTYHVVAGKALSGDVVKATTIKTVNGKNITVSLRDGGVFINAARIQTVDIVASNGVIHVIDTVLLP